MDLVPKPDQVVTAAGNVAHSLLYGGLADLRPMPRTLIDDGELRTALAELADAASERLSSEGVSADQQTATYQVDLRYHGQGLRLSAVVGMVNYGRLGLAPTSMPSHQAFTGIDSRVKKRGNWFGAGATFTF